MPSETPCCIHCERTSDEVPLIPIIFRGKESWICPQHLPVLIHTPAKLADKLPGVEFLGAPEEH